MFFILLFCFTQSFGAGIDTLSAAKKAFSTLSGIPPKDRRERARIIYRDTLNLRKASPGMAMRAIDELVRIARGLKDKPLECSTYELRADYFSVANTRVNALATAYYQKAVDFAVANNMPYERGYYLHRTAMYYATFKHNEEACRYFLRAQSVFADMDYEKVHDISLFFSQVGDFYYALGDYENARINLESALKYPDERQHDKINISNTIGLIYRNYRQFPQAINYFNLAGRLARTANDTAWVAIANGNIGSVYFLQGKYAQALLYVQADYKTSIKYNQVGNGIIALLRLVKINVDQNNLSTARAQLDTAALLLNEKNQFDRLPIITNYDDLRSQLSEKTGQISEAIAYLKKFEQGKDSIIKRNNIAAVERVKLQYEIDRHNAEVTKLKTDARLQSVKIKSAIVVMALLMGIAALWYYNERAKARKDRALLLAEKRRVDEELKNAEQALNDFTKNLRQKNALIEKFKKEIDKLKVLSAGTNDAGQLEELLHAHIMTDQNWHDFRKLFSKVHPGFFVNLSKQHPLLSATDTRMLALLKLGLNNSEMANMLGITVEGIQKAKQRLRKKMDITTIADIGDAFNID